MDQLQALADRQTIIDAMHRYCRNVDGKDIAGVVALFTDDCVTNYTRDDIVGPDALAAFMDKFIGGLMEATHHQVANIEVDFVDDGEATARSYVTAWHRFKTDRPDYVVYGEYRDRWIRAGDDWKIAERRIDLHGEVNQPR